MATQPWDPSWSADSSVELLLSDVSPGYRESEELKLRRVSRLRGPGLQRARLPLPSEPERNHRTTRRLREFYPDTVFPRESRPLAESERELGRPPTWSEALRQAGIPVCPVCRARNSKDACTCQHCGGLLLQRGAPAITSTSRPSSGGSQSRVLAFLFWGLLAILLVGGWAYGPQAVAELTW